MQKARPSFVEVFKANDRRLVLQPYEYEADGMKRVGLLACIRNHGEDAASHVLTQAEVRALHAYLERYEFFVRNAASIGFDTDAGLALLNQGEIK